MEQHLGAKDITISGKLVAETHSGEVWLLCAIFTKRPAAAAGGVLVSCMVHGRLVVAYWLLRTICSAVAGVHQRLNMRDV